MPNNETPVEIKSWDEFRASGLFWFVNTILHAFGWALVRQEVEGAVIVQPARVVFRGFTEDINSNGYMKLSRYVRDNAEDLVKESES